MVQILERSTLQRLVQFLGFGGNCSPTEVVFRALAAGFAKSFAQLPIFYYLVNTRREVLRELFWIYCFERTLLHLFEWNQESRLAIYDDFLDSADGARHDRSLARHRFKIYDAERFVD